MFEPVSMLAALAPTVARVFDAAVNRWIVPNKIKPASVDEVVALKNADNERLRIILQADTAGESYRWVAAIKQLQRPVVVVVLLAAFVNSPEISSLSIMFQTVSWYLFGERVTLPSRTKQ